MTSLMQHPLTLTEVADVLMLWLVFISLLSGIILYLMYAPIAFIIDTDRAWYGVRALYLADARIVMRDADLLYRVDVLWWHHEASVSSLFIPATPSTKRKKSNPQKTKKRTFTVRQLRSVLRAFRLRRCTVFIDTGNMQLNGILFPVLWEIARWSGREVAINFQDIVRVDVEVRCTLAQLGFSILKSRRHG